MKTVREAPGRPHEGRRTIVSSFGEKYFSFKFDYFCAIFLKLFRNFASAVPDIVMSPGAYILRNHFNIWKNQRKLIIVKINETPAENRHPGFRRRNS